MLDVHVTIHTSSDDLDNIKLPESIREIILTRVRLLTTLRTDSHLLSIALEFLGKEFKYISIWGRCGDPGDPAKERKKLFDGSPADILDEQRWRLIIEYIPTDY